MRFDWPGAFLCMGIAASTAVPVRAQVRPDTTTQRPAAAGGHAGHVMADTSAAMPDHAGMHDAMGGRRHAAMGMDMLMAPLGNGWRLLGMAQAFAMRTAVAPLDDANPLHDAESYLTQPTAMVNLEGPGSRLVFRATLNLEGATQPGGEYVFGGWGEGFLDRRHPHTLAHEAVLSLNAWRGSRGGVSLSAGKGFAPYGSDDPMSRPVAKYPTNHHLAQILERWMVTAAWLDGPWSAEAGIFAGDEPEGPWDQGNVGGFGESFSARVIRRFGGTGTTAPWELGVSYGSVQEHTAAGSERTALYHLLARHSGSHSFGGIYALAEAAWSDPEEGGGFASLLGETQVRIGRHRPYARLEVAERPEYTRLGPRGSDDFFRYAHDQAPIGSTRWRIASLGYEYHLGRAGVAARPFVEVQHHRVTAGRGGIDPAALFGSSRFWTASAGMRLFFGGGPMRMGSYGMLDDMTLMHHPLGGQTPPAARATP
jgi:hypothetical protein